MSSKLTLSAKEYELIQNADFFLTKRTITEKVYQLFASLQQNLEENLSKKCVFGGLPVKSAKIFKGENYLGLPWIMLDYPREFGKNDVFAIRTMFWWGKYFSVTLHLKGIYKEQLLSKNKFNLGKFSEDKFYIATGAEEFRHEVQSPNYLPASSLSQQDFNNTISTKSYFKIARMIPLTEWDNAVSVITKIYEEIIDVLAD